MARTTQNNSGLTLTELIISSVLIGFIMVGVTSFSQSYKRLENSTSGTSLTSLKTTGGLSFIRNDIMMATGMASNMGIRIAPDVNPDDDLSLCIRHDLNAIPTPANFSDDTWICYLRDPNDEEILKRCINTDALGVAPINTLTKCETPNAAGALGGTMESHELFVMGNSDFVEIVNDTTGRMLYVDVNITAIDPRSNETFQLSTQVNPELHTR